MKLSISQMLLLVILVMMFNPTKSLFMKKFKTKVHELFKNKL